MPRSLLLSTCAEVPDVSTNFRHSSLELQMAPSASNERRVRLVYTSQVGIQLRIHLQDQPQKKLLLQAWAGEEGPDLKK